MDVAQMRIIAGSKGCCVTAREAEGGGYNEEEESEPLQNCQGRPGQKSLIRPGSASAD